MPRMLRALAARGTESVRQWRDGDGVALVGAAYRWERERGTGGEVAEWDEVVVACDAALGGRDALCAALAGAGAVVPADAPDARLVAAAVATWGARAPERLEGTWAFAAWSRRTRELLAARDFSGARPLFWAAVPDGVLLASGIDALLADGRVDDVLVPSAVLAGAAWLEPATATTVRRGVSRLRAGMALRWSEGSGVRTWRHYEAPVFADDVEGGDDDAAALALRDAIARSAAEKLDPVAPTAVWMSGGYDSTAVFATLRHAHPGREVFPVSLSFPMGDSGWEDQIIERVAARWNADVRWVRGEQLALFAALGDEAARVDEPFVHLYASVNRALAAATRAAGARVVLGGYGGDQLFYASPAFLADLFARGDLAGVLRALRAMRPRGGGVRWLARWSAQWMVRPLLPAPVARALRAAGRVDWLPPHWRAPAPWFPARVLEREGLVAATEPQPPRRRGESRAAHDAAVAIAHPFFEHVLSSLEAILLEEGLAYRSPLYDRRLVALAAARPRRDRAVGREQKLLLRRAMRGLIPAEVLAPRPFKTGVMNDLFARSVRAAFPALLRVLARDARLADLGLVDVAQLRAACDRCVATGDPALASQLYPTLQAELWLRARERGAARDHAGAGAAATPFDVHSVADLAATAPGGLPGSA